MRIIKDLDVVTGKPNVLFMSLRATLQPLCLSHENPFRLVTDQMVIIGVRIHRGTREMELCVVKTAEELREFRQSPKESWNIWGFFQTAEVILP